MRYYTHIATSLAGAVIIADYSNLSLNAAIVTGVIIGSVLPDIDEPKSYIGRRSKGVSVAVKGLFGHRGITHSILPCLLLILVASNHQYDIFIGLAVGYIFHIVGDALSKAGVPLFLPFSKKRIGLPVYRTGGVGEKVLMLFMIAYLVSYFRIF